MIKVDKNALICDLAQTYGIYDMYQFKASYIAILACGLDDNSRIKKKISETRVGLTDLLLSLIYDNVSTLLWFQTEDGQKGVNRPKSLFNMLNGYEGEGVTSDKFEEEWLKRGGGKHG